MPIEESIRKRIDDLLQRQWREEAYDVVGEVYSATLSIAAQLYGAGSPQVEAVKHLRQDMQASKWAEFAKAQFLVKQCHGILASFASDIDSGRLRSLRLEYQGQVFADLVNLAKSAIMG